MSTPGIERLTFAFFTEPHEEGEVFETWSQHLTVFPPIYATRFVGKIAVRRVTENIYPFTVTLGEEQELGGRRVRLLAPKRSTMMASELHKRVLKNLQGRGVDISAAKHIGKDYKPHIRQRPNQPQLEPGQQIRIDHLALVTRLDEKGDKRQQAILFINSLK